MAVGTDMLEVEKAFTRFTRSIDDQTVVCSGTRSGDDKIWVQIILPKSPCPPAHAGWSINTVEAMESL